MTTPPHKTEPIPILKAPPPSSSMAIPSSSARMNPSTPHHASVTSQIVMSEDEDEDDLKYALSDGEDEEAGYIPSGKTLELLQTEKACYSGYLLKKGEKRRTWKKRWFVLRTTKLAMYKDKKEYKLLRIIDLHDIHSVVQVTSKNKYRYVFAIITPKRMYYVQADDQHTMDGWLDAIDQAKEELRQHDANDDSSTIGRDQEFAKDVVTSYKSNSSMTQRRRSSGGAPLEARRQSGGMVVASSSLASSPTNSGFSHSSPPSMGHLSSSPPPPVPPLPSSATTTTKTTTVPAVSTNALSSSSSSSPSPSTAISTGRTARPARVEIPKSASSPLGDYNTGHVYPLSPTLDQAQVHFAEGIASSEDDEDYSVNNSVIDVRKEEDRNRVLVEGYLLKLGRNKGWQKRWFVLRTDTLAYYENEKEYSPHRIIPLEHIMDTLEIEAISKNKQYCFKIIIPKRNYVLCASTEDDMEAWLNALSVAVRRSKKDTTAAGGNNKPEVAETHEHHTAPTTHQYHTGRLEQISEVDTRDRLARKPSLESFENSSHISGVSGAGGVGGAGGALGRH